MCLDSPDANVNMADCEEGDANNMQTPDTKDEVFLNGETDAERNNSMLHPEYGTSEQGVLPRRSSLIKDSSRRQQQRKKTVSFSSMPNEKTVVNGRSNLLMNSRPFRATPTPTGVQTHTVMSPHYPKDIRRECSLNKV